MSRNKIAEGLKVKSLIGHLWRGFIGTAAMAFFFGGLGMLPFPEVTAIGYASPILTVVFAAIFLGEKVRLFRAGAVFFGFLGVLIILYPRLTIFSNASDISTETFGAVLVLMGSVCMALAHIFIRKLVRTEQPSAVVFYFSISSCAYSLFTIPFGWTIPNFEVTFLLILAGLLGGIAQIFLTQAYVYSEASVVAPFEYASIIFAIIIGYFVFKEFPSITVLIGAGIVISAGIIIILRERHLGIKRGKAKLYLA